MTRSRHMIDGRTRNGRPHARRYTVLSGGLTALLVAVGGISVTSGAAHASVSLPCDVFSGAGTPCVAGFSTVRALYTSYNGPLYQVTRASDGARTDIGLLAPGGYANAAAQDTFCAGAVCTITTVYDQSPRRNDLTVEALGQNGSPDTGARADDLPITVAGHKAYGILVTNRVGYRRATGSGLATGAQAESMYAVASGTNATNACCFDFGNVETNSRDNGPGHMDALILSTFCGAPPCSGVGPWIQADLEDGVFMGRGKNYPNPNNISLNTPFVTAVLRNSGTQFALDGGSATATTIPSLYNGPLPNNYVMQKEGGIVLGTGGDNSNAAPGAFFEGAITSGYAANASVAAVQSSVAAANYSGTASGGPGVAVVGPNGQCLDVAGNDNGGAQTAVDLVPCAHDAADQHWEHIRTVPSVFTAGSSGTAEYPNSLKSLGRCLDVKGNVTTPGTPVQIYDCNGVGGQQWVQQSNGTLLNPPSGLCLTGHGTGNVVDIEACASPASPAQRFIITVGQLFQGQTIAAPGGKCVGVTGGTAGMSQAPVDVTSCLREAADQYWWRNPDQSVSTLGRCLDVTGNVTTAGTPVQLYDCNGVGGQKWVQQSDGSLLNPQSSLCLDDPNGNLTDGTVLRLWTCNGASAQKFLITGGSPVSAPGGNCVDVVGNDLYGDVTVPAVQVASCDPSAVDQHWVHTVANTLETMTRCLDIANNSSTPGAAVDLFNCNGVGGQQWVQQANGTLLNPQSQLCLTADTLLDINTCTGQANQMFTYRSATALDPGTSVSLRATSPCCLADWVRHQAGRGIISSYSVSSSLQDRQDATWVVHPGLANSLCVSFEASNFPGGYLRQVNGAVYQQQNDNSAQFAGDATFCPQPGKNGQGVSLAWNGNANLFLRHYNGQLYLASNGGPDPWDATTSWADDVSWLPTAPWLS